MVYMCKTKDKNYVSFVEGCGGRGWFQIRNNDSNREASDEDTVATKGQGEKLISEVEIIWLNI